MKDIAYKVSPIARAFWGIAKERPKIKSQIEKAGWLSNLFEPTYKEIFSRIYEDSPEVDSDFSARRDFHDKIHGALSSSDNWSRLVNACQGDYVMSSSACSDLIWHLSNMAMPGFSSPENVDEDTIDSAIEDWLDSDSAEGISNKDNLDAAIQKAVDSASVKKNVVGLIGGDGVSPAKKDLLLDEVENIPAYILKDFVGLIGRLKKSLESKIAKRRVFELQGSSIKGVSPGDDFSKLIPTEKNSFAMGGTAATMALRRLLNKESLCYAYDSTEKNKSGSGPIFLLLDKSSSTSGRVIQEIKAFALAVCAVADKEKRPVSVISFNYGFDLEYLHTEKDVALRTRKIMSLSPRGGTSFFEPIKEAHRIIAEGNMEGGDILMITDGQDRSRWEGCWPKLLANIIPEVRHHAILVGSDAILSQDHIDNLFHENYAYAESIRSGVDAIADTTANIIIGES